jgi:putative ABC transport system permease protein
MGVVASNGTARLTRVIDLDLNSPVTKGAVLLRSGRFPRVAGEALISPKLARAFHLKVGDTLRLQQPNWTEHIVGIGVTAKNWSDGLIAVRGNELASGTVPLGLEPVQNLTLVRLPGHPTSSELAQYTPPFVSATSGQASGNQRAVDWTLVAGMIALAIAGIVISGAFAVGARRQLVTLGQLSANGADASLLRRTLSLQGVFCGILGTTVGIAAGITTLVLMHDRFNGWIHRDIGPFVWSARDLVAISVTGVAAATIAAYLPSRSASRVPVLSALAGRRPLGALPKQIVPIGIALFGGGVLVLVLVATASRNSGGDGLALAAVFGGLLVLSGACCVSPVVVAGLAAAGKRLRRAGRVAARSLVRSRARSAAVVMALAAINAGAIAISTAFASRNEPKFASAAFMPNDALIVVNTSAPDFASVSTTFLPIPSSVEKTLRTILPHATWSPRRAVLGTTLNHQAEIGRVVSGKQIALVDTSVMIVADPAILRVIGLAPSDKATLDRVGVLVLPAPDDPNAPITGSPTVQIGRGASARTIPAAKAMHSTRANASTSILITPAKAQELGLPIVSAGEVVTNPQPFNESQRASLDALSASLMFSSNGAPNSPAIGIFWSGPASTGLSPNVVRQIVLAIVVLIALLVLAMSLALSAAETRDERDVLVALGAPPKTMRGVAAWKAGLLSFTAAALAVPTGFIPVAFVFLAAVHPGSRAKLVFPWSTVGELVILAPLIAALVAGIGSTIAQRVRPTQMSTFATD